MVQTIALFDVIGIKQAFASGDAASRLTAFWNAADAWTNAGVGEAMVFIPGTNTMQAPAVRVRTFSDSAVVTMRPEPSSEDFHDIALAPKARGAVERRRRDVGRPRNSP